MTTKKRNRVSAKIREELVRDNDEIVDIINEEGANGWGVLSIEKRSISVTKTIVTIIFTRVEA